MALSFLPVFTSVLLAGEPRVVSFTVSPPAPNFGDRITVTVVYCGQLYTDHELAIAASTASDNVDARLSGVGQIFIVSRAGINNHTSVPAASPGAEIGWTAAPVAGGPPTDCTDCGGTQGRTYTYVFGDNEILTMPSADNFPGCTNTNMYLHLGMKDNNMGDGEFHTRAACSEGHINWSIPLVPTQFTMLKRAEGVVQDPGDLLLFSIDYRYANGDLTITDQIPSIPGASFELVSVGPLGMWSGPPIGPVVGNPTITWNLPDRSNQRGFAEGTVWFLLRVVGTPTPGGRIQNTANGSITGPTGSSTDSHTTAVVVGQVVMTLQKDQAMTQVAYGDNVTYYLSYNINGSKLIEYQPFDDKNIGTYIPPGTLPPGWGARPEGGAYGTWYIEDSCGTGDRVLRGSSGNDEYPGLLINRDLAGTGCTGGTIIMADVLINPAGGTGGNGYEGSDALIAIRDDGAISNGNAYALVLSIDDFIGTNSSGNVGFQVCNPSCAWPLSVNTVQIVGNIWYRVKIETVAEHSFRAKVWRKGDPEPGAWTISYAFTGGQTTNMACSSKPWYAGVGQQGGANGTTQDSYNNFVIYQPRASSNTILYDTVPTGINYVGSSGPLGAGSYNAGNRVLSWNLGTISNEGGTYTWWAQVQTCDPVTNVGNLGGTAGNVISNEVVTVPICPTPVITLTKGHISAPQVLPGDSITWTLRVCNSAAGPAANPMYVWDTVPTTMNFGGYIGTAGVPASPASGGIMVFDASPLNIGACRDYTWWGTVK